MDLTLLETWANSSTTESGRTVSQLIALVRKQEAELAGAREAADTLLAQSNALTSEVEKLEAELVEARKLLSAAPVAATCKHSLPVAPVAKAPSGEITTDGKKSIDTPEFDAKISAWVIAWDELGDSGDIEWRDVVSYIDTHTARAVVEALAQPSAPAVAAQEPVAFARYAADGRNVQIWFSDRASAAKWAASSGVDFADLVPLVHQSDAAPAAPAPAQQDSERDAALVREAIEIQRRNYGNGMMLHLDMIEWEGKASAAMSAPAQSGSAK